MMKLALLSLVIAALAVPAHSQAFSKSWNFTTTSPWKPVDSIIPGAVVAVFSNIWVDQTGAKWYWRILIPIALSLGYEGLRWIEGKQPLGLNGFWAGVGAAGVTFVWKIRI